MHISSVKVFDRKLVFLPDEKYFPQSEKNADETCNALFQYELNILKIRKFKDKRQS